MAEDPRVTPPASDAAGADVTAQRQELAELAASRRDLAGSIARQIDWHVAQYGETPSEAAAAVRAPLTLDSNDQPADQVGWWEIERAFDADPEAGQALWCRVKAEASQELVTGFRAARSLEPSVHGSPYARAQFGVIVDALTADLRPRGGVERLLVHQLAAAYEQHLRWQAVAVKRAETEAWRGERDKRLAMEGMTPAQRERHQEREGWLPPRLGEAEAVEQAVTIADRYQRAFLRLLKAFRDTRRVIGAVVVGEGGTLNVAAGPQQVNIHQPRPARRPRLARPRRAARRATVVRAAGDR